MTFPTNPYAGQKHPEINPKWEWNGTVWEAIVVSPFRRRNHVGTQSLSTISDAGTAAALDAPASGDAAASEVVKGNDSRLSNARTPTAHSHTVSDISDFPTLGTAAAADTGDFATAAQGSKADNALPKAGGTMTGDLTVKGVTETVYAVSGTTPSLSPANGTIQTWTLSGDSTPTAGTWNAGESITLMIDDGAARTITWSSLAVTWKTGGGTAPTLLTTGYTAIQLWKVGSTIYGALVGDA